MKYYFRTMIAILILTTFGCKKSKSLHFIEVSSNKSDNYVLILPKTILSQKPSSELDIKSVEELNNINKIFVPDDRYKLDFNDFRELLRKKTLLIGNYKSMLLEDAITTELYEMLSDLLSQQGTDMIMYNVFQPWAIAMIYLPELLIENEIYYYNNIIDLINDEVSEDKIIPLRSQKEIIDFFSSMPIKEQETLLRSVLRYFPGHSNSHYEGALEYITCIESGEFEKAEKIFNRSIATDDYEYTMFIQFVKQSDVSFISHAEKELNAGFNSMIICDPSEIFGEEGMLQYFRMKGYKVNYY